MSDECNFCVVRGDIENCKATDCSIHENWYSLEQKKSIESLEKRVKELDDRLLDKQKANKALFSIYDESEVENNLLKDKVKELQAENERLGGLIHYPDCWDMAVYPKLSDALIEVGCSECYPDSE